MTRSADRERAQRRRDARRSALALSVAAAGLILVLYGALAHMQARWLALSEHPSEFDRAIREP